MKIAEKEQAIDYECFLENYSPNNLQDLERKYGHMIGKILQYVKERIEIAVFAIDSKYQSIE